MKKLIVSVCLAFVFGLVGGASWAAPAAPVLSHAEQGLDLSISWTSVPGAQGYTFFYAPYPFTGMETIGSFDVGQTTQLSYRLWEGAAFYLAVKAYDQSGSSDWSNIGLFIMGPPTPEWVDDDGDGFHENSGDCNDANPLINPAQPDLCNDGLDQDCSGADSPCGEDPQDVDKDGFSQAQGDCNDSDATVFPGAADLCADGIDQDCSGSDRACTAEETDDDGDGFTELRGDCNDGNIAVNPSAQDICEDGIDQDCSGSDALCPANIDNDLDGFTENQGDCDDTRSQIRPDAVEICGDTIDQDCSGADSVCALTAEPPSISPAGGNFTYGQVVTLASTTSGAQIRYTKDGSDPTLTSPLYSAPFQVNSTQTIKALAYKSGLNASPPASADFVITPSLTGSWAVKHVTGRNNCLQTVGEEIQFNAEVVQDGNTVTVTTQAGSGSGTLNGNSATWSTSQPVSSGSITGTLTFTMNVTASPSWNSFSGPTSFNFVGSINCSGVGTISGSRILP